MEAYRDHYEKMLAGLLGNARSELEALRQRFANRGVALSQVIVDGVPAFALESAATEFGADLVAVGSRGLTGWRRVLLGSVAEQAIRSVASDILITRGQPPVGGGYHRVLVPTDFSPAAAAAAHRAIDLAVPQSSRIDLVHFWTLPRGGEGYWARADQASGTVVKSLREAFVADAVSQGEALVAALSSTSTEVTYRQIESAPMRGIQRFLDDGDYDLVAVGGRPPTGIRRWFTGRVAEATARHAPCSVLVARP
jgi:nucleotide-binding universal stress UspA family protein